VPMAMGASMFRTDDSADHRDRVVEALRSAVERLSNPMVLTSDR